MPRGLGDLTRFKEFVQFNMSMIINGVKEVQKEVDGEVQKDKDGNIETKCVPVALVNKERTYALFREAFDSVVEFTRLEEGMRVPLDGIGVFKIDMLPPTKRKNNVEGNFKYLKFEKIPHLKWEPSIRYKQYLDEEILGLVWKIEKKKKSK